jgi:2-amino-4-hydroxy-6-hydroxymethyldihydropteridine diphosphokinase
MSTVYLGLGSNIDPESHIAAGLAALRELFGEVRVSPWYRAPAVGFEGDPFINGVARMETELGPLKIKQLLHELEDRHGRARDVPKFSDRTLDIDILLYDDLVLVSPELEIPRGEILTAAHVLRPLADLAPDCAHPATGIRFADLWRQFPEPRGGLQPIEIRG